MSTVALEILEAQRDQLDAEIIKLVGDKLERRDAFNEAIAVLSKSNGGGRSKAASSGPKVDISDEQLLDALTEVPQTAADLGKVLGVDSRTFARRLPKMAEAGLIGGNKEDGYTAS